MALTNNDRLKDIIRIDAIKGQLCAGPFVVLENVRHQLSDLNRERRAHIAAIMKATPRRQ